MNNHDNSLFPESLYGLVETADFLKLDIYKSCITLDSGFHSQDNKNNIKSFNLIPVIKPNPRGIRDKDKRDLLFELFEPLKPIYNERFKIERCFAWQDTYRKLVIRYEKLQCTHLGFKYLAYTLINYRSMFCGKGGN